MRYRLVRLLLRFGLDGFFRRITVQGAERIPADGPLLVVSNHTNAFVDPLLLLTRVRRRVTLTAKATLLSNPLLRPVIRGLHVILLHRRQDAGADGGDAARNRKALAEAVARLRAGGAVHLFPEGVSHSDPDLRTFHTGAARIALDHLADPDAPDLTLLPVGLHFERKDRWRSEAAALVGEPRSGRAWLAEAREGGPDPARAPGGPAPGGPYRDRALAQALTSDMERWIRSLTTGFRTEEERRLVLRASALLGDAAAEPDPLDRPSSLDARAAVERARRLREGARRLAHERPARLAELAARVDAVADRLDALGVHPSEVRLPLHPARAALFVVREAEILLVGLPMALWGWLNHLPALEATRALVRATSTDEDHWASNAVFLSIPVFGLAWALQVGLAAWLLPAWGAALYALSLPPTGLVALRYRDRGGGVLRRVRTFLLFARRPAVRAELVEEIDRLADEIRAEEGAPPAAP